MISVWFEVVAEPQTKEVAQTKSSECYWLRKGILYSSLVPGFFWEVRNVLFPKTCVLALPACLLVVAVKCLVQRGVAVGSLDRGLVVVATWRHLHPKYVMHPCRSVQLIFLAWPGLGTRCQRCHTACCRAASVLPSVKQSLQDRTDIWRNVTI